ncbi:MAG: hypothetical protein GY906_04690 [bacterium]|nr:hypothetical protein [bacterium]
MTAIGCEGFETYGESGASESDIQTRINATSDFKWSTSGADMDVTLSTGYDSEGLCLDIDDAVGNGAGERRYIQVAMGSAYNDTTTGSVNEYCVGFHYYNGELDTSGTSIPQRTIWYNSQGTYGSNPSHNPLSKLIVANNSVDLIFDPPTGSNSTMSGVLTKNTWHFIELWYKPTTSGANGGFVKIYVDQSNVLDVSASVANGPFYKNLGFAIGSEITVGGDSNDGASSQGSKFDNVYWIEVDGVTHTAPLEDCRVKLLSPTSDGTPSDWTASTGSDNYALVDEQDWDETDYVEAATGTVATPQDDNYGLTTLGSADSVEGLRVDVVCKATDGTPSLHIGFDDGTVDVDDRGVIGTSSTVQEMKFFPQDPSSAAWTVSSVNSVEATQRMTE